VSQRLEVLEAGQPPISVAPLSAAERLATLEEQQRGVRDTLTTHAQVHVQLADGIKELVTSVGKMQRNLIIAAVILFGGTTNGSKVAEVVAQLFS
jgi:hypothetical protein